MRSEGLYNPFCSSQVLAIDPFKELSMTLQTNMTLHPLELGQLFVKDDEERDETFFESSLRKFGGEKVFKVIEECLPLDAEWPVFTSFHQPNTIGVKSI